MYVSAVNSLCILVCVATIVGRTTVFGSGPGNSTAEEVTTAAAIDDARVEDAGGHVATGAREQDNNKGSRPQEFQFVNPKPPDVAIECKALRSKRYITDGFCTSLKPVEDMVCTGNCLPISDLPWYAEFIKVWSRTKTLQYRCVDDSVRYKRVTFVCDSGETRSYKIRVVRSCKCKKYLRNQNESPAYHQSERSENRDRRRLQKLSNLSNDQK